MHISQFAFSPSKPPLCSQDYVCTDFLLHSPSNSYTSLGAASIGLLSHHNHLNPKVILHCQHLSQTLKLPASKAYACRSFKVLHVYLIDIQFSITCFLLILLAIARVRTFLLTSTIRVFDAWDLWSSNRALRVSTTQVFKKDFGGHTFFDVAIDIGPVPSAFI